MASRIVKSTTGINLEVEVFIVKESKYYVAYCPSLELSAYGDNADKAMKSFKTELNIFLKETSERGTLEKYLLKNGWKLQQLPELKYEPPRTRTDEMFRLSKSLDSRLVHHKINIPV